MKQNYIFYAVIALLVACVLMMGTYIVKPHFMMMGSEMHFSNTQTQNQDDDLPFPGYNKAMDDHCDMMPGMSGCAKYLEIGDNSGEEVEQEEVSFLDADISELPDARKVEVVELKDGDTYTMEVTQVRKQIGNDTVMMLAYNGSVPGPILRAPEGSKVTLHFVNKVEGLETTLHPHGLRGDYKMDGVPKDMMGTQEIMQTGDSFDYELIFPDTGIFWYHPHVREDLQQELGLAGNFIVTPKDENYWSPVNREETLILDDVLIENGKIAPISNEFANYILMGRFGNTMLINGETNYTLKAKKGETMRLNLTNVSNTRVYKFEIPGVKIKRVGGDIGKYERQEFVESIIIAPAERYIVDILLEKTGTFEMQNNTPVSNYTLGKIIVSEQEIENSYKDEFNTLRVNDDIISDIDAFREYFDRDVDKEISLDIDMKGMMMGMMETESHDGIEWEDEMVQMNKMHTSKMVNWDIIETSTGDKNMDIQWDFKSGDVVKIRIKNEADGDHPMQHPIHFHGQRFLVIDENGVTQDNLVWKDTVLVKMGEYVDIIMDMSNPGQWMAHCHIAEHLTAGMMMHFSVE